MGKILVLGGLVVRLGLNGRIPFPLVVVHSGNTTMIRWGFCATKVSKSVNFASFSGYSFGCDNARNIALKREMHST